MQNVELVVNQKSRQTSWSSLLVYSPYNYTVYKVFVRHRCAKHQRNATPENDTHVCKHNLHSSACGVVNIYTSPVCMHATHATRSPLILIDNRINGHAFVCVCSDNPSARQHYCGNDEQKFTLKLIYTYTAVKMLSWMHACVCETATGAS